MDKLDKFLCGVKNPSNSGNRSWLYNIFFGNLLKNKKDHKQIKTNWILELTEDEIELLREKDCEVTKLDSNHVIKNDENTGLYQKGSVALVKLFLTMMKKQETKNIIRNLCSKYDPKINKTRPTKNYHHIIKLIELLEKLKLIKKEE